MLTVLAQTQNRVRAHIVARDTFTRTAAVGAGIGNADTGQTWTLSATGTVSINGTQLVAALTAGSNRTATLPVASVNSDTVLEFQASALPTTGQLVVALCARSVTQNEQIRGKLTVDTTGALSLRAYTISPTTGQAAGNTAGTGAEVGIAAAVTLTRLGTLALNTKYRIRMQVKGQTVRVKMWLRTQQEPAAWDFTGTQSVINVAGGNGWRTLAPTAPATTFTLDDFVIRTVGVQVLEPMAAVVASGTLASIIADATNYPNGSTVLMPSTTYYEDNLTFPAGRVLTLLAAVDGGPTLSAYNATPITSGWTQVGATPVYSQGLAFRTYGLMVNGRPLLEFSSLANLTNAKFADGTTEAPPEGFYSDGTTLYLRLEGGGSPNGTSVSYVRSGLTSGTNGTGITLLNTNSITFEGWVFEGFPRRGIFVNESATLITRRCWFKNTWRGLEDTGTTGVPTSHIRIESCMHSMRGTSGTYNGVWNMFKAMGKNVRGTSGNPDGLYGSNLGNSGMFNVTCDDLQVDRCVFVGSWDAGQCKGRETAVDYGRANRTSYIRNCLYWQLVDNGLESETGPKYMYIDVYGNIAVDCFQPFATAPFMAGEVEIHHNVALITTDYPTHATDILAKGTKHTGAGAYTSGVQTGLHIYNNTFILAGNATQHSRWYDSDPADFTFTDSYYRDNIFLFTDSFVYALGGMVLASQNLLWHGGTITGSFNNNNHKHSSAGGTTSIWTGTANDTRPTTGPLSANPLLGSTSTTRFNLQSGSPCIGVSSTGGDLGAVPFGSAWTMPQVGCQWAAAIAVRPTVPASIDVSLMGLQ